VGFNKGSTSSDSIDDKEKVNEPQYPKKSHDIKCFKCLGNEHIASEYPNKRAIAMHGKYKTFLLLFVLVK
jgi:hypothetical protein